MCSKNGAAPIAYTQGSNIAIDEDDQVVCTFTNTKDGRIEIEKQTIPDGSATSFTFTGDVAGSLSEGSRPAPTWHPATTPRPRPFRPAGR